MKNLNLSNKPLYSSDPRYRDRIRDSRERGDREREDRDRYRDYDRDRRSSRRPRSRSRERERDIREACITFMLHSYLAIFRAKGWRMYGMDSKLKFGDQLKNFRTI